MVGFAQAIFIMMTRLILSALAAMLVGATGCGGTASGGDCTPTAERCDGVDNDCDERIDEDAVDMDVFYADNDGDGFGSNVTLLACEAPPGYADNSRDCDDEDDRFHPGAEENCEDPNDYNCDGSTMYADADGDGVPACNDCNDADENINPNVAEVCNGVDDNCSGNIDDAPLAEMCGDGANGQVGCRGPLGCKLLGCNAPYTDLDGDVANGCECEDLVPAAQGATCQTAIDLGDLADNGVTVQRVWNLARASGEVWYRFRGSDLSDTSCDNYHVRILLDSNPNAEFQFDVRRGSCTGAADPNDSGLDDYSWYTDFRATVMGVLAGECPCTGPAAARVTDRSVCENSSAEYYVRVHRNPAAAVTCTSFSVENTNGVYDSM